MMMKRFDARYIGFLGISIFAISCFMNITLSADTAGDQFSQVKHYKSTC
jgi:DHA2 family multidrug resistance protein